MVHKILVHTNNRNLMRVEIKRKRKDDASIMKLNERKAEKKRID
jgi:hypothetical protein